MISDAYVLVSCDGKGCKATEEIDLTAITPPGAYDTRNVVGRLDDLGWLVKGGINGRCFCPDCREDK